MGEGFEMLLTRWTWTATGDPLSLAQARAEFGARVQPWHRPGWFWSAATPLSAARIREHGHHAVGSAVTTWIPPQSAPHVLRQEPPTDGERPAPSVRARGA